MSDVVDLDALMPPSATIHFGGRDIVVNPPKTSDILRLSSLGQKLQVIDELSAEELDKLVDDLTGIIVRCIPDLANSELNTQQLLKVMEILSKMAVPPDVAELEKRGITVGDPKAPLA